MAGDLDLQQLTNGMQAALNNLTVTTTTEAQGTYWGNNWYWYPNQLPAYCSHNIGQDEELLLNAIRRSPELKKKVLKTALEGLLKEIEKAK